MKTLYGSILDDDDLVLSQNELKYVYINLFDSIIKNLGGKWYIPTHKSPACISIMNEIYKDSKNINITKLYKSHDFDRKIEKNFSFSFTKQYIWDKLDVVKSALKQKNIKSEKIDYSQKILSLKFDKLYGITIKNPKTKEYDITLYCWIGGPGVVNFIFSLPTEQGFEIFDDINK